MYIDDITRLVVGRRAAFLRFLLSVSDLGRQKILSIMNCIHFYSIIIVFSEYSVR